MVIYRLSSFDSLDTAQKEFWRQQHRIDRRFQSPFFHPEFSRGIASVRSDVKILIAESRGETQGILPIQVPATHCAEPVGGKLNDRHGSIVRSDVTHLDGRQVLRHTGLGSLSFHAANVDCPVFRGHYYRQLRSPIIDLSTGYEMVHGELTRRSRTLRRQGQKTRGLLRDWGELRFEYDCRDQYVYDRVVQLKREQYRRTRTFDMFRVPWARNALNYFFNEREEGFGGVLSVLWAGNHLVAGHIGLRSRNVLHYWFPAYDLTFSKYSPGALLIQELIRGGCEQGVTTLDLGYGEQAFKYKWATSFYPLLCGRVSRNRLSHRWRQQADATVHWIRSTPVRPVAKHLVRSVYPGFGKAVFR